MRHIKSVLAFGWPYLRRYQSRFVAGILLGILFGVSNLGFVWASKTLIGRMDSETVAAANQSAAKQKAGSETTAFSARIERTKLLVEQWVNERLDPWLPRQGRALDWQQLVGGLLLLPGLVAARGFVGYLSSYCMGWVSERVVNDLRVDVLEKLQSLSLDYFNRSSMGDLITRVNGDTLALHRSLSLGLSDMIKEPVAILSVFVAICLIDWKLSLFVCLFLPLCLAPLLVLGRKARFASKANVAAMISQGSLLLEALSGIRVVKAFGLEERQVERFRALSRQIVASNMKSLQARELTNPLIETVAMLGLGILLVMIFYTGTRTDDLVGFLTGAVLFFGPVKKLGGLHILFQQTSVGVERLLALFAEHPTVREADKPIRIDGFHDRLALRGMHFTYGDRPVLQDITLDLPRGHKLGVAGESGSGKSTLVNLLFRFYDPTAGAILIDGQDLRTVAQRDLQQLMALVSQEIVLFDLTVAENIACGRPGASRAEIESAARAANAHDFIQQLPHGYDTRVGERGVTLSGGQRQRLAVARAFIRNAPILLLDEATASLDSASEAEVQAAIERLEKDRTVVCVAHRLSTLAKMDHILVLKEGRLVEQGTYAALLAGKGVFAAMARKQGLTSD